MLANFGPDENVMPEYKILLHESINDRFDAEINYPSIVAQLGQSYLIKITKTNVSSISSEESFCTDDFNYGPGQCQQLQVIFLAALHFIWHKKSNYL